MDDPSATPEVERLREELARKTEEVRILREVSSRLNATLELEGIQDIVLHTMHDLFGFTHSLILLADEPGGGLRVVAGRGYPELRLGARVEVGAGVIGMVAERRRMVRIGNLTQQRAYLAAIRKQLAESGREGELGATPELPGLPEAECQVAIPLLIGERLVGVFAVESVEQRTFSEADETRIAIVANLCASAIHNALLYQQRTQELQRTSHELTRVQELRSKERRRFGFDDILGTSAPVTELRALLKKVAKSPASTILITGENGTGKDLAARIVHDQSARAAAPFMNITCSALAETLLESELFGHERGAFTDAHKQKKGLFELADGGTVFLDEIGEMSLGLQAKLLRFLESKTFRRVGGSQDLRVDVRIVAATNRELDKQVASGAFRQDLYYRLRVLPVELPPLRDRAEDVPLLVRRFLQQFRVEFGKPQMSVDSQVLERLAAYPWPGNVRELRNAVERAVLLAEGERLRAQDFGVLAPPAARREGPTLPASGVDFEQLERSFVVQALERSGWNKARAARLLGMPRDWLRYRMEKFGLVPPEE